MNLIDIQPNSERWLNLTDLPNEEWKDIKGFEGLYRISNYGRVKSLKRTKRVFNKNIDVPEIIRKNGYDMDGYQILPLNKNSKKYTKKIHRLVAETFIPNLENKPCINHLDCNRNNNKVDNLEWCTQKENNLYTYKLGRLYIPEANCKKVIQKDKNGNILNTFSSVISASSCLGLSKSFIASCCRKEKNSRSFIFEYADSIK